MASTVPPVKGTAYTFEMSLISQADTDIFQTSVTLADGDVQVSKNGGAFANIGTLPSEIGTSGVLTVTLAAGEVDDRNAVRFHDVAGDEWQDALVIIHTAGQSLDTMDGNIDSILDDTGTDIPASIATVDGIVDSILVDTGTDIPAAIAALNDLSAAELLGTAVEGTYTLSEVLQLMAAVLFGKTSGGGTTTVTFRDTGDSADRVTAVVDSDGNRSSVVLNV